MATVIAEQFATVRPSLFRRLPSASLGMPDFFREPSGRLRLYFVLGMLLYALAWTGKISLQRNIDFVNSDGRYYYVFLPSVVVDGDLDFRNQMLEHWGRDYCTSLDEPLTDRGFVQNQYPIGLALSLAPSFALAHALSLPLHAWTGWALFAPDGYSVLYQGFNLLFLQMIAVAALWLADRLCTQAFGLDPTATGVAVLCYWFGSNFAYYCLREPFMCHLCGAFWVNATLWNAWRLREASRDGRLPRRRVFLLTFCTAMTLICRPSNAFLLPVLAYVALRAMQGRRLSLLLRALPAVAAGLIPLALQMATWHLLYGHAVHYTYGDEGFHWLRPAVLQSLFSSRHGLFFWSPLLLIAAAGFAGLLAYRGRRESLLLCLCASSLMLMYCNSSWHCWWFGDSFGGRAYIELNFFFILGLAAVFTAARRSCAAARWTAGAASACVAYSLVMMALYIFKVLPPDGYLF